MVLPAPVPPTMPTVVRAGMLRLRPSQRLALGQRVGIVHVDELEPLAQVHGLAAGLDRLRGAERGSP